jgi:stage III sporulation protein AB
MKWIGAVFILFATSWFGFYFAKQLTDRTKQIRAWKLTLQSLEAEIMYSQLPLQDACRRIADQMNGRLREFLLHFSDVLANGAESTKSAWMECLELYKKNVSLKQKDIEILMQFGETLGMHDKHSQQKQIVLALRHLEREEQEALENHQKYDRMAKTLGVLAGILLIILLI